MRKRIVGPRGTQTRADSVQNGWLDLDPIATVEVTSEDPAFPIESALRSNVGPGWRASQKGEQLIRIIFDDPVAIHHMELHFDEPAITRTQEFTVRWSSAAGGPPTEIVRQQWNFSPAGSTEETEHYVIDLDRVSVLELAINPDISREGAVASLSSWRLG
jgi:uncharacterized protein (DUF736 family)